MIRIIFNDYYSGNYIIDYIEYADDTIIVKSDKGDINYYIENIWDSSLGSSGFVKKFKKEEFDLWIEMLDNTARKMYSDEYKNEGAIINTVQIMCSWSSEELIIKDLYSMFGGYQYEKDEDTYLDATTIVSIIVSNELGVIDLKRAYEFGSEYTDTEGVEYLNEKIGKAKGLSEDPFGFWLDEKVPNPNPKGINEYISRSDALNDIQSYINKKIG